MTISIIIPVYNVEPYIQECLESVAAQTYKGAIECLIIDDCGKDKSIAIAESFIASYQGDIDFKIISHEKNRGLSAARNTGIENAKGDYLFFLDSDDLIASNCLEKMVETIAVYPDAEVIQGGIITTTGVVDYDITESPIKNIERDRKKLSRYLLLPFVLPVSSWNKLIKRQFLLEHGISFMEGVIHEDVDFIYKIAKRINAYAVCHENTYIYRAQREGSILNTLKKEKAIDSRLKIYEGVFDGCIPEDSRKYVTRSLFLRLQLLLNEYPFEQTYLKRYKGICKNVCGNATPVDRAIMSVYYLLPIRVRKSSVVSSFFNNCFCR